MVIATLGKDSSFAPSLCPSNLLKGKFVGISRGWTNSCLTAHSPAMLGRSPDPKLDYLQRAEKFCSEAYSGHNGTFEWTTYMMEHNIREMIETFDNITSFFLLWPGSLSFESDDENNAYTPTFTRPCSTCPDRPFSRANFSTEMSITYRASEDLIASIVGKETRKLCFSFDVLQPSSQRIFACDEYFQWDGFACYHTRFDPCEVATDCQFDRQTNLCTVKRSRWSWLFKISCTRQKPTYATDINCPCDPCRNSEWSQWSSVDVACGRVTKQRYRVKTGRVKKSCGDDDDDCCYDRMVVDLGSCGRQIEEKAETTDFDNVEAILEMHDDSSVGLVNASELINQRRRNITLQGNANWPCQGVVTLSISSKRTGPTEMGAKDQKEQDEKAMKNAIIVLGVSLGVLLAIVIGAKLGTKKSIAAMKMLQMIQRISEGSSTLLWHLFRNHGKVIHHRLKCPNKKSHARRQEEARYADPQETTTSEHYGIDV
ncbi:hypothetical protein D918_05972 [Trichuris suis]|nr:hypothetical protein D918_05972 [Trichuris suis]